MNQIKNYVQLIGHLGSDINLRQFDGGKQKAEVAIATTNTYKDAKGELVKDTQWHNIVAWGPLAQRMQSYLKKGSYVLVHGALQYKSYQDKAGVERKQTLISIENFIKLDKQPNEKPIGETIDMPDFLK